MSRDSLDRAIAAALWAALTGGVVLLLAYFVALPMPLLLAALLLLLASVVAVCALAVIVSRGEGIGLVRALGRGSRAALSWAFWFMP